MARTLEDLLDIHAIHELKHRYLRCLDQKAWEELESCFTEDATASYGGGAIELDGRDAILRFLTVSMSSTRILTSHRGSQPKLALKAPDAAPGTGALEDVVSHQDSGVPNPGANLHSHQHV